MQQHGQEQRLVLKLQEEDSPRIPLLRRLPAPQGMDAAKSMGMLPDIPQTIPKYPVLGYFEWLCAKKKLAKLILCNKQVLQIKDEAACFIWPNPQDMRHYMNLNPSGIASRHSTPIRGFLSNHAYVLLLLCVRSKRHVNLRAMICDCILLAIGIPAGWRRVNQQSFLTDYSLIHSTQQATALSHSRQTLQRIRSAAVNPSCVFVDAGMPNLPAQGRPRAAAQGDGPCNEAQKNHMPPTVPLPPKQASEIVPSSLIGSTPCMGILPADISVREVGMQQAYRYPAEHTT